MAVFTSTVGSTASILNFKIHLMSHHVINYVVSDIMFHKLSSVYHMHIEML